MSLVGVAIFAKTVSITPVKTRLAVTEGRDFAEDFYRASVAAIGATLRDPSLRGLVAPYWAVAEANGVISWRGFQALWQGGGGVGDRLATVFELLKERHRAVIIIGTDTPQLTPALIAEAARWVKETSEPRCALGPAHDGGFYLFGSNLTPQREQFTSVVYSSGTAFESLRASVAGSSRLLTLPPLSDLDTSNDLTRVMTELRAISGPTVEQLEVLRVLEQAPSLKR